MVWQVVQVSKVPVIGLGGIVCVEDALEFLLVGAKAVQVGTANFVNPQRNSGDNRRSGKLSPPAGSCTDINEVIGTLEDPRAHPVGRLQVSS